MVSDYGEHCGNVGDGQIISYRMKWRSWSATVLFKGMLPFVSIQAHLANGHFLEFCIQMDENRKHYTE